MEAINCTEAPGVRPHRVRRVLRGLAVLAMAAFAVAASARAGWAVVEADLPGVADVEAILDRIKTLDSGHCLDVRGRDGVRRWDSLSGVLGYDRD